MKDIGSICVMSHSEEHFQQDGNERPPRNPRSISQPDRTDTPMGQFRDLTNPTGASIMDWTERLIELTLSTDEMTGSVESANPSVSTDCSESYPASSDNITFIPNTSSSSLNDIVNTAAAQKVTDFQQWQGSFSSHDAGAFPGNDFGGSDQENLGGAGVCPVQTSASIQSSYSVSLTSTTFSRNQEMWDTISSWAAESLGSTLETMAATTSASVSFPAFGILDHQYSSPLRERVDFPSQSAESTTSQHSTCFGLVTDESCTQTSSATNIGISTRDWSDTSELQSMQSTIVNSSVSSFGTSESMTSTSSAIMSLQHYNTSTSSHAASSSGTWLHETPFNQISSSHDPTNYIHDSLDNTIQDITDSFIDYATIEVGPSDRSASASTESSLYNDPQDSSVAPVCYSGTVTICRADDISFSLDSNANVGLGTQNVISDLRSLSSNQVPVSDQPYLDLDELIPQALRSCIDTQDLEEVPCLTASSGNHQVSESHVDFQSMGDWDSCNVFTLRNEQQDGQNSAYLVNSEVTLNTPDSAPFNALYNSSCSQIMQLDSEQHDPRPATSKASLSFPIVCTVLGTTWPIESTSKASKTSESYAQQLKAMTTNPINSTTPSSSQQGTPKTSFLQPVASTSRGLSSLKTPHNPTPSFAIKPVPSELSTDALLSPGDVFKTFSPLLACLNPPSVGPSTSNKSSLSRTVSDVSDISLADSDASGSFSVLSVASGTEGDSTEDTPKTGNKLKDTLRSKLKAKRRVAGLPEKFVCNESSKSSSSITGALTPHFRHDPPSSSQRKWSSNEQQVSPSTSRGGGTGSRSTPKSSIDVNADDDTDVNDDEEDDYDSDDNSDNEGSVSSALDVKERTRKRKGDQPEEDEETRLMKREKNRLAARRCRHNKINKIETLTAQVKRLEEKQTRMKTEVDKLEIEKEQLEEMLRLHSLICPSKRKQKK